MYCIAAESDAVAATTMVNSIAPCSSSFRTTFFTLLVDDRVPRHGGLAGLAVADDQFALAPADRHHRVDRLDPGLHRRRYPTAPDHPGGHLLDHVAFLGVDR